MEMRSEDVVSSYFVRGRICKSIFYRSRNCIRHLCRIFFLCETKTWKCTLLFRFLVSCFVTNAIVSLFSLRSIFFVIDSSKTHDRTQNWLPRKKKRGEGGDRARKWYSVQALSLYWAKDTCMHYKLWSWKVSRARFDILGGLIFSRERQSGTKIEPFCK